MTQLLAVFIGGGVGSLLRFGISKWVPLNPSGFPMGTFIANVLACSVLGLAFVWFSRNTHISQPVKLLVMTGFCGGFSTFSTFSIEVFHLLNAGKLGMAILYVSLSVIVCLLVIYGVIKWG